MRHDPARPAVGAQASARRDGRIALCLITDRRRLTAALGLPFGEWRAALLLQIRAALAGGIDLIQIRERDLDAGILATFVRDAVRGAREGRGRIVVNDRVDVALACGAHGVHLREDGLAPVAVRRVAPEGFVVGRSVHSPLAAAASAAADYLIAGPVFATPSKPGHEGIGADAFRAIAAVSPCPVWAVGGIAPLHTPALISAGAAGFACISAFMPASGETDLATSVQDAVENLRFAFDSSRGVP